MGKDVRMEYLNMKNNKFYFNSFFNSVNKSNYDLIINSLSNKNYLFTKNHSTVNDQNYFNKDGSSIDFIVNHEEIHFEGPEFKYFLNEYGFRSKKFSEFNKNNVNILFLGCSITQGVGLPENSTWYKKLIDKISNENPSKKIDFYNIAMSGIGVHTSIKNLITFLNKVGKPNYIFAYFPDFTRSLIWDKDESMYFNVHFREIFDGSFPKREIEYSKNCINQDLIMRDSTLIHMLELICMFSNINLIWSTWVNEQEKIYEDIGFNDYFYFHVPVEDLYVQPLTINLNLKNKYRYDKKEYDFLLKKINKKNINSEPYWSSARDGMHFGSFYSEYVAEQFFIKFKNKYGNIRNEVKNG